MSKVYLMEKWPENTSIERWNKNRHRLNKVIHKFNKWQTKHNFDYDKSEILLAHIELGLRTFEEEYHDTLKEMKSFVLEQRPVI